MSTLLTSEQIIKIAITIEKSGIAFYDVMARSSDDTETKNTFEGLLDMERHHLSTFEDTLREFTSNQVSKKNFDGTNVRSLQSLVASLVFTDDLAASELASKVSSPIEAIELAIDAEKDSILFYYEARELLGKEIHSKVLSTIEWIMAEERDHLSQLSDLKRLLATSGEYSEQIIPGDISER